MTTDPTSKWVGVIHYKVTETSVVTDAEGLYRLTLLYPATYQLKFRHPEFHDA